MTCGRVTKGRVLCASRYDLAQRKPAQSPIPVDNLVIFDSLVRTPVFVKHTRFVRNSVLKINDLRRQNQRRSRFLGFFTSESCFVPGGPEFSPDGEKLDRAGFLVLLGVSLHDVRIVSPSKTDRIRTRNHHFSSKYLNGTRFPMSIKETREPCGRAHSCSGQPDG